MNHDKLLIASVSKKVGSHFDHQRVLSTCQDEKLDYHRL